MFVKYSLSAFYCSDKFVGLDHSVWGLCPDGLYDFAIILSYIHLENSSHLNNNNKNNKNSGKNKQTQNNTTKNKQQQNKNKPVRGTDIVLASKFCCIIWCVSSVLFLPGWLAKFGYLSIVSQNWRLTSLLRKITDQWIYLWNSSPKYKNIRCFGFIFLYIYLT